MVRVWVGRKSCVIPLLHTGHTLAIAKGLIYKALYKFICLSYFTCTVQETFEDTLVCVRLRRIVTVVFWRRVQRFYLLTYLLIYLLYGILFLPL